MANNDMRVSFLSHEVALTLPVEMFSEVLRARRGEFFDTHRIIQWDVDRLVTYRWIGEFKSWLGSADEGITWEFISPSFWGEDADG